MTNDCVLSPYKSSWKFLQLAARQLLSGQQGMEKAGGTAWLSRTKSLLPGHSTPASQAAAVLGHPSSLWPYWWRPQVEVNNEINSVGGRTVEVETHVLRDRDPARLPVQVVGRLGLLKWNSGAVRKIIFFTWLTRAAKAGQKSIVLARRAQRNNQGRVPLIYTPRAPICLSFNSQQGPFLSGLFERR